MILEFPNYVNDEDIATILNDVHPHVENGDTHMYNRDGKTVNITSIKELSKTDQLLHKIMNIIGMIKDRFVIIIQMESLVEMLTKDAC